MLASESRLDYVVHVPHNGRSARVWVAQLREAVPDGAKRIVGPAPEIKLDDYDRRPGVCRTRITLASEDETRAEFHEISFSVDRNFVDMLRPGDVVHIAQGWRGGLGLSVLRGGVLVAAAGSVSAVPLGDTIIVRPPGELAREVLAIYRARDPKYQEWEVPVQIETDIGLRLLHRGRVGLGRHEFFVVHGFIRGVECVAVSLLGVCPDCAATLTAPLLVRPDAIRVRPFHDPNQRREIQVLFALESARAAFEAGDLDGAERFACEALAYDRSCEQAQALLEDIEGRRRE